MMGVDRLASSPGKELRAAGRDALDAILQAGDRPLVLRIPRDIPDDMVPQLAAHFVGQIQVIAQAGRG